MMELNKVNVSILHDEKNNLYNLIISDDYITAKFTCDENERIIPPGCILSKVHIHHEQNLVAYRQLSNMVLPNIIHDDEMNYLLPGYNCMIEVDDELKIYTLWTMSDDTDDVLSEIVEQIYVDISEYEAIDGSRSEFIKNRMEIFNDIIKDHQDSLYKKHNQTQ